MEKPWHLSVKEVAKKYKIDEEFLDKIVYEPKCKDYVIWVNQNPHILTSLMKKFLKIISK